MLEKLKEGKAYGTLKNYLASISHFLDWLVARGQHLISKTDVDTIRAALVGIVRTVNKFIAIENQNRKIKTKDDIIPMSQFQSYRNKNMAEKCIRSQVKNLDTAACLRNHIITDIALTNGKRTGVLTDLSITDFSSAIKSDKGFIIMVAHGKTYKTYGASNIFLTQPQHKQMQRYIHEYRPLFNPKTEQVFCKINGLRSEVGDVGRYLQEAWTAFGTVADCEVTTNISCTLIRKSVISCASAKGFNQEQRRCMAKAMDHSVPVAERYYNHDDNIKNTEEFNGLIRTFQHICDEVEEGEDEPTDSTNLPTEESDNPDTENEDEIQVQMSKHIYTGLEEHRPKTRKPIFSLEERQIIHHACSPLIEQRKKDKLPVKTKDVLEYINSSLKARSLLKKNTQQFQSISVCAITCATGAKYE